MGQKEEEPENDKSYCIIYSRGYCRGVMVHIFVLIIFAEIFQLLINLFKDSATVCSANHCLINKKK